MLQLILIISIINEPCFINPGLTLHYRLLGGIATPLKNMSSSVGIIIPNIWKNQINVPNHQPVQVPHTFKTIDKGCYRYHKPPS